MRREVLYWDASALVKRYAAEPGTPVVNAAFSRVAVAVVAEAVATRRARGRMNPCERPLSRMGGS